MIQGKKEGKSNNRNCIEQDCKHLCYIMDDLLQHVCGILILFAKILVLQTKPQNRNIYMTCGALTQMFPLWHGGKNAISVCLEIKCK